MNFEEERDDEEYLQRLSDIKRLFVVFDEECGDKAEENLVISQEATQSLTQDVTQTEEEKQKELHKEESDLEFQETCQDYENFKRETLKRIREILLDLDDQTATSSTNNSNKSTELLRKYGNAFCFAYKKNKVLHPESLSKINPGVQNSFKTKSSCSVINQRMALIRERLDEILRQYQRIRRGSQCPSSSDSSSESDTDSLSKKTDENLETTKLTTPDANETDTDSSSFGNTSTDTSSHKDSDSLDEASTDSSLEKFEISWYCNCCNGESTSESSQQETVSEFQSDVSECDVEGTDSLKSIDTDSDEDEDQSKSTDQDELLKDEQKLEGGETAHQSEEATSSSDSEFEEGYFVEYPDGVSYRNHFNPCHFYRNVPWNVNVTPGSYWVHMLPRYENCEDFSDSSSTSSEECDCNN